jgi:DnaJ-class molecular chaperone
LNADALRPEFRRMAKIIHPDKNKHPNAGNAFQKIYKVYEAALSRLEGTQQKI